MSVDFPSLSHTLTCSLAAVTLQYFVYHGSKISGGPDPDIYQYFTLADEILAYAEGKCKAPEPYMGFEKFTDQFTIEQTTEIAQIGFEFNRDMIFTDDTFKDSWQKYWEDNRELDAAARRKIGEIVKEAGFRYPRYSSNPKYNVPNAELPFDIWESTVEA